MLHFIDVDLVVSGDDYRVQRETMTPDLPDDVRRELDAYTGELSDVTLGVRPEDLHDASEVQTIPFTERNTFEAEVKLVKPMGSDRFLTVEPFEDESVISARFARQ